MGCSRDENHWDWERDWEREGKKMQREKSVFDRDGTVSVYELARLPPDAHYAALITATVSTPGYDRNDPPSSETIIRYIAFENEAALRAWIIREDEKKYTSSTYRIIKVEPVTIKKTVAIELG